VTVMAPVLDDDVVVAFARDGAIFFDFLSVHGAPGFRYPSRRRILSLGVMPCAGPSLRITLFRASSRAAVD